MEKSGITGRIVCIVLILVTGYAHAQQHPISKSWVADQGNGTYKNPILNADYSDPDAIRVGNDYYLVASSFNCMPGLPILHSKDLVNWTILNYAVPKLEPAAVFDQPQHGKGIWAPCIRYHNKQFYVYYPDPDRGIFMVKAKDPAGLWSAPVLVLPGKGIIDPAPFWDDDGRAYLGVAWAGSRALINSMITIFRMDKDGTKVTDDGRHVYDGHDDNPTIEGPKIYKKDGFYYIFAPAGGVSTGWQLALRSKNIYGPYEAKKVMAQGKTTVNGPHQGAWVQTQAGVSWFLHFQDKGAYGRVLHLQPMLWKDGWPVIGIDDDHDGTGEPVSIFKKPDVGRTYAIATPEENDEFNGNQPGLQWQWHANSKIQWSSVIPGSGYLRLFAFPYPKGTANLWPVPNLLLQKFPAPDFVATTKVAYKVEWDVWQSKKAGLIITGNDYGYLSISKDEKGFLLNQVFCKDAASGMAENIVARQRLTGATAFLRVSVSAPDALCQFSYSEDGITFTPIGKQFKAQADKWIGAKVGLFCVSGPDVRIGGYADFDWFRINR